MSSSKDFAVVISLGVFVSILFLIFIIQVYSYMKMKTEQETIQKELEQKTLHVIQTFQVDKHTKYVLAHNYTQNHGFNKFRNFDSVLLIFNDNLVGEGLGGNAQSRYYSNSLGIPTGDHSLQGGKGFTNLMFDNPDTYKYEYYKSPNQGQNYSVKDIIDMSITNIKTYLKNHPKVIYVIYSGDSSNNQKLGTNIFQPGVKVVDYITDEIHKIWNLN